MSVYRSSLESKRKRPKGKQARLELRVLFEELLKRTIFFEINDEVQRTLYPYFGYRSIPVSFKKKTELAKN